MNPDLKQLMEESDSIIDLEDRLKEFGYNFKTHREYTGFLDKGWEKRTSESLDDMLNSQIKDYNDFPTLEVESEGITYLIHGIAHGQEVIGWNPGKIRKSISTKMNSYHNPEEGEDYLYEERFREHFFDLLKSQELTDITSTESRPTLTQKIVSYASLLLTIPLAIPICIIKPILVNLFSTGLYLRYRFMKNPKGKNQTSLHLALKALSDEKQQVKYAEVKATQEMPQPFQLEGEYLYKLSFVDKVIEYITFSRGMATSGERSLWTSRELVKYAKNKGLKRLHYLGGLGHLTEIAYFLKNLDYSFERLENYRTLKKR